MPLDKFWDDVPKGISISKGLYPWSCSCGQRDNWLCRMSCKKCGRDQPHYIAADARKIAERTRRERADAAREGRQQGRGGSSAELRGRSRERAPSRGSAGTDNKQKKKGGGAVDASKTYSEAASAREKELERQVADLKRKLATAPAAKGEDAGQAKPAGKSADGDEDGDGEDDKEAQAQQLADAIAALEKVQSPGEQLRETLAGLREQHGAVEKARREGRPLKAQLLGLDRKIERKRNAIRKAEEQASEAHAAAERARIRAQECDQELAELQTALEALENEKRDTLRRELDADDGGVRSDNAHCEGFVAAIRARTALPGVAGDLQASINATLELLLKQCTLLPAHLPQQQEAGGSGTDQADAKAEAGGGLATQRRQQREEEDASAAASAAGDGSRAGAGTKGVQFDGANGDKKLLADPPNSLRPRGQPTDAAAATNAAAAAAGNGKAAAAASDDDELQDATTTDTDMEAAARSLPQPHRDTMLAAMRGRKGSGKGRVAPHDDSEPSGRDGRERSPRPTKNDEKDL